MKKKLRILLLLIATLIFLHGASQQSEAKHLAAPACSGYYGKFTATNWPGGKVTVTCEGFGRQRGECVGEKANISPGQSYHFSHCNCLDNKNPCLKVTGLPKNCKLKTKSACAANRQSVRDDFVIICTKPGTTNAPTKGPSKTPTKGPSKAPTYGVPPIPTGATKVPTKAPTVTMMPTATVMPTATTAPTVTTAPTAVQPQTYVKPVWYCMMLGENVGDWVGCDKK